MNIEETMEKNGLLAPTSKEPPVEVSVQMRDEIVTDEDAVSAYQRLGMAVISPSHVVDMAKVGLHLRGVGITRHQQGSVVISEMRVHKAMADINELITQRMEGPKKGKAEDVSMLAHALGYLMRALTGAQQLMISSATGSEPGQGPVTNGEPMNRAFVSGQPVRPGNQTLVIAQNVNMPKGG